MSDGGLYAVMTDWWSAWGQTVMWAFGAVMACLVSLYKFQRQLDVQFNRIDRRLLQIEIVLGIRKTPSPRRMLAEDDHG